MRKIVVFAACVVFFMGFIQAQKVTEGSLAFIKNVTELDFEFDYKKTAMSSKTDKDKEHVQGVFLRDLNKEVGGKGYDFEAGYFPESEYVAKVTTLKLNPGYMAGPMTKPSSVRMEIVVTERKTSKVVAKVYIKKAKGSIYDLVNTFGPETNRIGSSYGEAGEKFGKAICKIFKK